VATLSHSLTAPLRFLLETPASLFPWSAVFLATGIGLWFSLEVEPGLLFYGLAGLCLAICIVVRLRGPELFHPLVVASGCVALGVLAAGLRGHLQASPMLDFRYYGPVEGRIIDIDRSQSDKLRITLDQVVLERTSPERTPATVRVSLHGEQAHLTPIPGMTVVMTAMLAAPEGPAEPGGFDFRRMAYFDRLGAVGYTRTPVLVLAKAEGGAQMINRVRTYLSNAIMAAVPGDSGAFASGVMTGDQSGISRDTVVALRNSNLAHLLAISGMNMAFITGFVFALIRYGMALVPRLALRVNSKKVAALFALAVAAFYLALSGANLATERAFITVVVMLGAVLMDRRALSLRTVAISAFVLLLWQPESLLEPGFQMSYAATVALIWGFGMFQNQIVRERIPRWTMPIFTLVMSSVIAGAATAPFAAAHFNRLTGYGLVANLLTVPVMGAVVMPAGAVAALLAPFGLAGLPLWVMDMGSRWILWIAHWIASLDGAVSGVHTPPAMFLPVLTLGALWVILFQGKVRAWGLVPILVAFVAWGAAGRPALLISSDAVLVGLLGDEGRAMSSAKGARFSADSWLENDGDLALQEDAAGRLGFNGPKGQRSFVLAGLRGIHLKGKAAEGLLTEACGKADFVIIAARVSTAPPGCRVIDEGVLRKTGAMAVWAKPEGLVIEPALNAKRLWTVPSASVADVPILLARKSVQLTTDQ
jgi:competence protein ComEC